MSDSISKVARTLGYAGLIPFIALTIALFIVDADSAIFVKFAFQSYAAVILTFIGGVHWGLIIKEETFPAYKLILIASILPSLLGWTSLLLPQQFALTLLLASFLGLIFYEYKVLWASLFPVWYRQLRVILTTVVCLLITIQLIF